MRGIYRDASFNPLGSYRGKFRVPWPSFPSDERLERPCETLVAWAQGA
jgi:hypothetical protein